MKLTQIINMFQFLKGTIRPSNRGGFNLQQVDEFQFLKGTIRQLKWRAAPSTSKSFNSSKVRYDSWSGGLHLPLRKVSIPQRYDTTLQRGWMDCSCRIVSIPQRYDTTKNITNYSKKFILRFQFLKGTIRQSSSGRHHHLFRTVSIPQRYDTTHPVRQSHRLRRRFNSSKVRYDLITALAFGAAMAMFQFLKGTIRQGANPWPNRCGRGEFQFLKGTIRQP